MKELRLRLVFGMALSCLLVYSLVVQSWYCLGFCLLVFRVHGVLGLSFWSLGGLLGISLSHWY